MSEPENTINERKNERAAGVQQPLGIFFFPDENNAAAKAIDFAQLSQDASKLPGVVMVRTIKSGDGLIPEILAQEIRQAGITSVVLAAEHPGFYQPAFARALVLAGVENGNVRLASFAERNDCTNTEHARDLLNRVVAGLPAAAPVAPEVTSWNAATLVIGAGIAGIQAALEIAASGNTVYMVERTGTVGGRMAMFDKTFPTLDCAACILTPKMVAVGQNPNIKLLMLSEVQQVTGSAGNFKVKILKHATRVDPSSCVACGDCAQFCPTTTLSDFDRGIATRKAIFIPFPQAVPNTYMVDESSCLWVASGGKKCGVCVKKCAKNAIDLDAKDETVELEVGNIIVATGYDTLDAGKLERYGYGANPNVLTSLEFERLTNASGPTGGKIVLKTKKLNKKTKTEEWVFEPDGPKPKAVAILHCVGSRDRNYNAYCSRVCCMYSLKFAHLVREKLPDAECIEYYIDMRAYGKGYEEFSERIHEEGVKMLRGRPNSVTAQGDQLNVHGEDVLTGRLVDQPVDMVILSVGLVPSAGCDKLGKMLAIPRDADGWFKELDYNAEPTSTGRDGIYIAGVCQGPKDIPDTVAQASAAAAGVLRSIVAHKSVSTSEQEQAVPAQV